MELALSRKPTGRPSKYKPEYDQMLYKHLAQGYSFESFLPENVESWQSTYRWLENQPSFREAKKKGEAAARKLFEGIGMNGAIGKIPGFNVAAWIFIMKNRFGWRDQVNLVLEQIEELEFEDPRDVTPQNQIEELDLGDE